MKVLLYILFVVVGLISTVSACAQEPLNPDTSVLQVPRRPHILYAEIMGRGGYWNIGYGYSFFQREKHELNSLIGVNFMYYGKNHQSTVIPVGIFYRYGYRFKAEVGLSIVAMISWPRFYRKSHWTENFEYIEIPDHDLGFVPSVAFVYATKNQRIEMGLRYTPIFSFRNINNVAPVWFGAFFHYRLNQRKK